MTERPEGPLIWVHVPGDGGLAAVTELIQRLHHALPAGLTAVVTGVSTGVSTGATAPAGSAWDGIVFAATPEDKRISVQAFLDHWRPDVVIWTRGHLRRHAISAAADRRIPLFLVDAAASGFDGGRLRWWPNRTRSILRKFTRILTTDTQTLQRLRTLGAQPWTLEKSGALQESALTLPYDEDDRADLAEALAARPVWYATDVPEAEGDLIIKAHSQALRRGHRLLLILSPRTPDDAAAFRAICKKAALATASRSERLLPDADDQVFIADTDEGRGLYYRVAPISYIGGTLQGGQTVSPFEAATLGSALVHGPRIDRFRHAFARLSAAGGSLELSSPNALGPAISTLNAPDQAAALAHAAWDVASSGAAVTDRVMSLITAALPMPSEAQG